MTKLCQHLDEIWEENKGEVVLFLWTSFLKDEAFDYLEITTPLNISGIVLGHKTKVKKTCGVKSSEEDAKCEIGSNTEHSADSGFVSNTSQHSGAISGMETGQFDNEGVSALENHSGRTTFSGETSQTQIYDPRAVQDIASQELLLPTLLEHDKTRAEVIFRTTLYTCQVCFAEKLGVLCMRFPGCDHVFCKDCMKGFFEVLITEGNVKGLTCPSENCDSQAHPGQVRYEPI